jgi:hypothetical protein
MKKVLALLVIIAFASLSIPPAQAWSQTRTAAGRNRQFARFHRGVDVVPKQYVVVLKDETPRAQVPVIAARMVKAHGGKILYLYQDVFKGFTVTGMAEPMAIAVSRRPEVKYVVGDGRLKVSGVQSIPREQNVVSGLDRIDQRFGIDDLYTYPRVGSGVHVYVVDTGVWQEHNDFGGRAFALFDYNPSTSVGGFATGNDNHGTLTAGVIGSKSWGVAKNCRLYSVRVASFADGTGTIGSLAAGLQAVAQQHIKPAIASIGVIFQVSSNPSTAPIDQAITSLLNAGVTVVVGAGNSNTNAASFTPPRMAGALTVGATSGDGNFNPDDRAFYSNFGSGVDLFAPGGFGGAGGWFVRGPAWNVTYGLDGYAGTSAAQPHVAGAAALYLEQFSLNPTAFEATPGQVHAALVNNATQGVVGNLPFGTPNRFLYLGCEFIAPPAANPIDESRFFIRQHYYDFLNRQPDQGGWDFWVGTIEECNGDPQCIQVKRINGSRAFFESIEFLGTGYYVFRLNKISFATFDRPPVSQPFTGPWPRMEQFFADQKKVGSGVIVGQPGWEQTLDANQSNLAEEWVSRPRFLAEYPLSMSDEAFVDKLYTTAGVSDPATRDVLVAGLNNGTESRATAVKKVALSNAIGSNLPRFFNPAYVLMQYFGYLRRNPDDDPDGNLNGFNFWLNELNSGVKTSFDMVNAFISSIEYRERFFKPPFCN